MSNPVTREEFLKAFYQSRRDAYTQAMFIIQAAKGVKKSLVGKICTLDRVQYSISSNVLVDVISGKTLHNIAISHTALHHIENPDKGPKLAGWDNLIFPDGSIKVGCTFVSADSVDTFMTQRNELRKSFQKTLALNQTKAINALTPVTPRKKRSYTKESVNE
jgi:hypothetical protein